MKLRVLAQDDRSAHLVCEGDLVATAVSARADPLDALLPPVSRPPAVLLDLSQVGYINSTGISWLVQTHRRLQQNGGRLVLHSVQPFVRGVLHLMRLDTVLQLADDEPAARALLGGGRA